MEPCTRRLGGRDAVLLYGGFLLGVVAVTWPLAAHPATLWPPHHDPRVFTWVMASIARRLLTDPLALFQGNAFYPNGNSLAYTELLLPLSLLGLPGFVWGNPILTYNLLLLTLWPLNGLAMAWVAHAVTASRPAAWLAGAVFCLSPYFTDYYLEFQMLLVALLPVVLYAWVRWLETGATRWLVTALGGLTVQALATWYYAVILGVGLVILAVAFLCLRWRGWAWRRRLVALGIGGLCVGAVLLPFARPYFTIRREFGYERGIRETAQHFADATSFVEGSRRSRYYQYAPSNNLPETTPFVGFSVLVLAAASLTWLKRDPSRAPVATPLSRAVLGALIGSLLAAGWLVPWRLVPYRVGPFRFTLRPGKFLDLALSLGLALLLVQGWVAWRANRPRFLSKGDWVRCLLLLTGVCALLALGPVIHVAQRDVGPGLYRHLYHLVLPLHLIRVTVRFAVLTVAGLALLAALGLRAIEDRFSSRPGLWRVILVGLGVALVFEYAVTAAEYESVHAAPRAVDRVLRADPSEIAVLEWPTNNLDSDSDAMFHSLSHGKLLVNGASGFIPPSIPELSDLLSGPVSPFPGPEAQAALRRIYPLRYLVVRLADPAIPAEWRPIWRSFRRRPPPLLQFLGSFGSEDLYQVISLPEEGNRIERAVSHESLRRHAMLALALRPRLPVADLEQFVEIRLNDRVVDRVPLNQPAIVIRRLEPPFFEARPNVVALVHRYQRPSAALDARYRIGTTGVLCPGDLTVSSSGDPTHRLASVRFNGVQLAPDGRGYNLVALDSGGHLVSAAAFDTFESVTASVRLATWIAAISPGTIVAGAVRDEGARRLTDAAVRALRTLGVAGDVRGRYREAHAFVGVKGAPFGSALERLGGPTVSLAVGRPPDGLGIELTDFALSRPADSTARSAVSATLPAPH
jgi:Interleukin-like EMT inducer